MTEKTFDEVIEAHREAIGATQVRVTLGPEATPEGIAAVLEGLRRTGAVYASFTELEQERAKVNRLTRVLDQISDLTATGPEKPPSEELLRRLREIENLADLVPDVDLEEDITWMRSDRDRRGEPHPPTPF